MQFQVRKRAETNQEAYDNVIMAVRIAEECMLPVMVCYDGFITSHSVENIEVLEDDVVKSFVGEYTPKHYLLNPNEYVSMGPLDLQNYFFEHRKQLADAMVHAKDVILKVSKEFEKISGRKYDLFESYKLDDAEMAVVVLNSTAGTAKVVVDKLRSEGIKAGLVKPRAFRPLPYAELAQSLKHLKALAIMDKADSVNGMCGPMYSEIVAGLAKCNTYIPTTNYIYGLGGRDVKTEHIEQVFNDLMFVIKNGNNKENTENKTYYLGVRD